MVSVDTPRDQSISLTHTIGHDLGQPLCTLSTTLMVPRDAPFSQLQQPLLGQECF